MKTEELKEYLGIVVDLEQNIFLQKRLISNMEDEIRRLKIPTEYADPDKPVSPKELNGSKKSGSGYFLMGAILLFVPAFFVALLIYVLFALFLNTINDPMVLILTIWAILSTIWAAYYFNSNKKSADEKEAKYLMELKKYQKAINDNMKKRQQDETERKVKTTLLQSQRTDVIKSLISSTETLKTVYEKNIIFPKYRNLVMVCSLYEYICAGRCDTLEGHEGAYNILETEIRLDRIVSQLDQVIARLEQIQQNQFMLYSAIQNSNQRLSQIMDSTSRMASRLDDFYNGATPLNNQMAELNARIAELQASSALTAYHTERTQKELAYMNRMDYLAGRNDDVFFNHPPV